MGFEQLDYAEIKAKCYFYLLERRTAIYNSAHFSGFYPRPSFFISELYPLICVTTVIESSVQKAAASDAQQSLLSVFMFGCQVSLSRRAVSHPRLLFDFDHFGRISCAPAEIAQKYKHGLANTVLAQGLVLDLYD